MNLTNAIVTWMCAALAAINITPAEGWRGLTPLRSTRADVERLLGSPRELRGAAATYETESEKFLVFYSLGPCANGNEWNIPRGTVISFTVSPRAKLLIADLRLDEAKYRRVPSAHAQGVVHYYSKEGGVRVETSVLPGEGEDITSITYEPSAEDGRLRCAVASAPSRASVAAPAPFKLDEYSNILLRDEWARLDNFAAYLQQDPKRLGYIIAYAGRRARAGEARARAERAKDYLVRQRGVEQGHLRVIEGGHREESTVELYVTLRGAPEPVATPTVDPGDSQVIEAGRVKNNRP